ncbi:MULTISPECIES: PleD family two-component system response regulator [unclassified Wenzhouxiangella]|uniref:response regulator n=1 Tax=unclassified Wenzhouxiangella TaxID=2613841 RepID=UPI000E32A7DA|nr:MULTISPECIES: response regulator [unclassified Wenzhouxiangella]RFF27707.1 response regulator [Wenzhouxiangella sp. 15181]RFP69798.1 response regulator [Wenzhouxiangella sp. 15190]
MSQLDRFRRLLGMRQPDDRRQGRRLHARRGMRVLVVDDSRTIVAALGHMLNQNGYETRDAGDAETALKLAAEDPPDLIFLDIVLPGMSGFTALRKLRRHPATESVPVIMISGNPQAVEEFYLKKIGADGFMKKPFGRYEVFSRIERLVSAGELPARGVREGQAESD